MTDNQNLSNNQNQNENKRLQKNLKKLNKQKIKQEVKRLKEENEYERYVISGSYTDKINNLKNSFIYGIITKDEYNQQVEVLQKERIQKMDEIDFDYKNKIQEAEKIELSIEQVNITELTTVDSWYRVSMFFNYIFSALKNKTFTYILRRILSSLITLSLIIFFIILLLSFIPDESFYDINQYSKIKNSSLDNAEFLAEKFKQAQLYQYGRMTLQGRRIGVFEQFFNFIYNILPIPKTIYTAIDNTTQQLINPEIKFIYFGKSIKEAKLVTDLIKERALVSFVISISTLVLNYIIAYPLGIAMSRKPGSLIDKLGNIFIVLNYAIPALVFYLFMNRLFGIGIGGISFGFTYDSSSLVRKAITLIPPIFCITFLSIPGTSIWVRRFMVDQLNSDYVKFAQSKGLSSNRVLYTHVLRNAIVPLVRSIPGAVIFAFVGSYFVESIWNIPGTGLLLVSALSISNPDVNVILSLTTIYAGLGMLSLILGDMATIAADPRIKLRRE